MLDHGSGSRGQQEVVTGQVTANDGSPYSTVPGNKTNRTDLAQTDSMLLCLARRSGIIIKVMSIKLTRGTAKDDSS